MLLDKFPPMTGAASPNRIDVVDGGMSLLRRLIGRSWVGYASKKQADPMWLPLLSTRSVQADVKPLARYEDTGLRSGSRKH
jgi:hypothetical protein